MHGVFLVHGINNSNKKKIVFSSLIQAFFFVESNNDRFLNRLIWLFFCSPSLFSVAFPSFVPPGDARFFGKDQK